MQTNAGRAAAALRARHVDLAAACARESPEASGAVMTEHRLVATGEYGRQPSASEAERTMSHCVNAAVEHAKVAGMHAGVDGTAAKSKRCQLSPSHDALLACRQRPDSPFALAALLTKRVRLTMHGNVKDTCNRIRPWLGLILGSGCWWRPQLEVTGDRGHALERVVGAGAGLGAGRAEIHGFGRDHDAAEANPQCPGAVATVAATPIVRLKATKDGRTGAYSVGLVDGGASQ